MNGYNNNYSCLRNKWHCHHGNLGLLRLPYFTFFQTTKSFPPGFVYFYFSILARWAPVWICSECALVPTETPLLCKSFHWPFHQLRNHNTRMCNFIYRMNSPIWRVIQIPHFPLRVTNSMPPSPSFWPINLAPLESPHQREFQLFRKAHWHSGEQHLNIFRHKLLLTRILKISKLDYSALALGPLIAVLSRQKLNVWRHFRYRTTSYFSAASCHAAKM